MLRDSIELVSSSMNGVNLRADWPKQEHRHKYPTWTRLQRFSSNQVPMVIVPSPQLERGTNSDFLQLGVQRSVSVFYTDLEENSNRH